MKIYRRNYNIYSGYMAQLLVILKEEVITAGHGLLQIFNARNDGKMGYCGVHNSLSCALDVRIGIKPQLSERRMKCLQ